MHFDPFPGLYSRFERWRISDEKLLKGEEACSSSLIEDIGELSLPLVKFLENMTSTSSTQEQVVDRCFQKQRKELFDEIEAIKQSNQLMRNGFQKLAFLIENDLVLTERFQSCYAETQAILLTPYEKDQSDFVSDPIAEEWRQGQQETLYFQGLLTRLQDFLDKNPTFYEALINKIEEKDLLCILMKPN